MLGRYHVSHEFGGIGADRIEFKIILLYKVLEYWAFLLSLELNPDTLHRILTRMRANANPVSVQLLQSLAKCNERLDIPP